MALDRRGIIFLFRVSIKAASGRRTVRRLFSSSIDEKNSSTVSRGPCLRRTISAMIRSSMAAEGGPLKCLSNAVRMVIQSASGNRFSNCQYHFSAFPLSMRKKFWAI